MARDARWASAAGGAAFEAEAGIGIGSRAVITGDLTQVDLPRGQKSGLAEAVQVLADVRGVAFTRFLKEDVVRHPLVARIVDAYEKHGLRTAAPPAQQQQVQQQ